jgi:TRAP-type C4-dicarboxylate transport system permease small subunit
MLRILTRIVDLIGGVLFAAVAVAIMVSMIAGTADVVFIRLLSRTVRGSVEFSQNLMPIIVFGSLAYVQRHQQHIRVEFLYDRLGPTGRAVLDALNALIVTIASAALTWVSWRGYQRSNAIKESGMAFPFPIYPVKGFIVIGLSVMVLKMFIELLVSIERIWRPVGTAATLSTVDRVVSDAVVIGAAGDAATSDEQAGSESVGEGSPGSAPSGR